MPTYSFLLYLFAAIAEWFTAYQLFSNFLFPKKQPKCNQLIQCTLLIAALFFISLFGIYPLNTVSAIFLFYYFARSNFECVPIQAFRWTILYVMIGMISEAALSFAVSAFSNSTLNDLLKKPFELTLVYVLSKAVGLILVRLMSIIIPNRKQELNKNILVLLLFPICAVANEFLLLYLSLHYTIDRTTMICLAVVDIMLIAAGFSIAIVYDRAVQKIELEEMLERKEKNEETNKKFLQAQNRIMKELQSVLHDYKNQLRNIQLTCGDSLDTNTQCDALMVKLQQQSRNQMIDFNNIALSNIVYLTQSRCEQLGIELIFNINYADFGFLEALDVSTLFDNAFDNAIQACSKITQTENAKLQLFIFRNEDFVLLKFANSCEANLIQKKNRTLASTKPDATYHGFGIRNITQVAEKYGGGVSYEIENNIFTLLVRLKIKNNL